MAFLLLALVALAPAATWTGGGASDNWSDAGNWGGTAPVAGEALVFAGNTRLAPINDFAADTVFASITFSAGAGDFVLTGNALTLSGGTTALRSNAVTGTMTVDLPLTFGTVAPTITSTAGGTLVVDGAINNGGLLMTVAAGGPVMLAGAITGTGGLTKSGTATLTLSGLAGVAAGNYSGDTVLGQGTLALTGTVALSGGFTFGATAGNTTVSAFDLSAGSATFTGVMLGRTNSASYNTVVIGAGQTLTLAGGLTLGLSSGAATTTRLSVSGAGSMAITGGNVQIGVSQATANAANNSVGYLDLSGLTGATGFAATVTNFNVGQGNTSGGWLALTNTTNTITAATMNIGHSNGNNGTGPNLVTLGTGTNEIRANTLNIGISKISGTLTFASQAAGSPGTLIITNQAGTGGANITIGSNNGTGTGSTFTGLMDLRGHQATVQAGTLQLGIGSNSLTGSTTGILRFDTGTFDVNTITMAAKSGGGGTGTATGTLLIDGGSFTVASTITTASNTAATGSAVSTITLSGGTTTLGGNVTRTGGTNTSSTLTLSGGTLNAGGRSIGSATQNITGNFQSGSLANLAEFNGGGTWTKSTVGVLTVSGTNAWSGTTAISAGTVVLGAADALPSGTGKGEVSVAGVLDLAGSALAINGLSGGGTVTSTVANACVLTLGNNNASASFAGVLQDGSGTVAVTKLGTGTQTLSGANTYTGATTVTAGALRVDGSLAAASAVSVAGTLEGRGTVAGTVTVANGGTIAPGSGGTDIGTLTIGAITGALDGGYAVDLDGVGPTADLLATAGNLALAGPLSVISASNAGGGKVYTIISAASLSGTFAGLADGATVAGGGRFFQVNYTPTAVTLSDVSAVWDGGGADDLWSTAANWEGDTVPVAGANLVFAGTTRLTPVNDLAAGMTFASINFSAGAGDFAISGNAITLTGGAAALGSAATTGTMTISAPLIFSTAPPTITTSAGGALVLSGTIDNGGLAITTAVAGPLTISGALNGSGQLIKAGTAAMTLSGQGSWSGGTLLTRGDLVVAASGGAVTGPLGTGTLTLDSAGNPARVLLSGGQTVSNALVMTTASPGVGLGALQYTGTGVATWNGPLTINANNVSGGHIVGGADATNALVLGGTITTGGSLTRLTQRDGFVVYAGAAGNVPHLTVAGTARWAVDNTLPATAQISVSASGSPGDVGIIDLDGFDQTITALTFQNQAGGTIITGPGTLTLTGDISTTFTGTLTGANLITGNLALGGATRTITVANSTAVNDLTISAVISDGTLTKAGAGRLELSGAAANTYTGVTTVSAGALYLNKSDSVVAVPGDLAINGGQVVFGASGQIAATSAVTMSGTTSVFNGTAANAGNFSGLQQTLTSLTVTGGAFNCGGGAGASQLTVTGAMSFTGGGNTIFIGHSGTVMQVGSLELTAMTAQTGGNVVTNNSFTLYGNYSTQQTTLIVGAGGLTLNNSRINLRRGTLADAQGSLLVLDGPVTTSGAAACTIGEDSTNNPNGPMQVSLGSVAGASERTFTVGTGANLTINVSIIDGAATPGSVLKQGGGVLVFSGGVANTYGGTTTLAAGRLALNKTAGITSLPGDLLINDAMVSFGNSHQIADTATVSMSGTTSVFNGTGINTGQLNNQVETIGSLTVTGGCFNAGGTAQWTITGQASFTGGGNTLFVGNNGFLMSVGGLSLSGMTATAGGTVATSNSFTIYGSNTARLTTLTIGAGGLTLDGSVLNLRRGGTGSLGSRVVLNGDLTTTGSSASAISEDTNGGTVGNISLDLSNTAGAVSRTLTVAGGGGDLTIGIPIVDGAATPGSLIKSGVGALTTTRTNTWSGTTTVLQGALYLVGTQATSAVTVESGATLGGSGNIAGTLTFTGGTLAPGSGGTTIGQLSSAAAAWDAAAATVIDLNGSGLSDRLDAPGQALAIAGPLTVASLNNETVGQTFTILSGGSLSGTFDGLADGAVLPVLNGGKAVRVNYLADAVTLTVKAPPTVTAIMPASGGMAVEQPVVITGSGFEPGATVTIGGTPATSVVWVDDTTIEAVTPTGAAGRADVVVINPDTIPGTLVDGYVYIGPVPTLTAVSPAFGPAMATTAVTITGTNLLATASITVGGVAATDVVVVDASTITATFPQMAAGSTDLTPEVVLTNGDTQQATLTDGFTYTVRPSDDASAAVAGLAYRYHRVGGPLLPDFTSRVPFMHGARVDATITGSNPFESRNDYWSVEFGGYVTVPADGIYTFYTASDDGSRLFIGDTEVVSNNFAQGVTERSGQIALAAGAHQLRLEFAQGNGGFAMYVRWQGPTVGYQEIPVAAFSRDPAPVITSVSPSSGPQGGGTSITITGSGFVPGSLVLIGNTPAILPVVLDDTTLTATTPAGALGAQDLMVIGPRSTAGTLAGGFTYGSSPDPELTAISPVSGAVTGGTTVTLTVANIGVTPTVTFNGVAATSVVLVDPTTVTCVTPGMPATDATADVVVTVGGRSATLADGFTWELRAPENPSGTQAGLAYAYHRVGGPLVPTFDSLTPFSTGIRAAPGITPGTNPFEARNDTWSVRYRGYLTVPSDGFYTLYTASDDGSRLYIGQTLVVDNNFAQGVTERSGQIGLSAGSHLLTLEFAQGGGGFGFYVRWLGPGLAKADIPASAFSTDPTPVVGSLTVVNGPQSGGTALTISGSGFTSSATVSFGGTTAVDIVVVDSNTITCVTPSHAVGVVDVVVTNPTGVSGTLVGGFTYDPAPGPTIVDIAPATGSAAGGTPVTITGTGFGTPMTVTIGGQAATGIVVQDANTLTALTPAMNSTTLTVDVVIANGGGQSATLVGGFTYTLRQPENPTLTQAGLTYRYHRVGGPLLPAFSSLTPYSIDVRSTPTIAPGTNPFETRNDNWSVEYHGYVTVVDDGVYTFFTESDDGSQLLIGDAVVVQNNFAQGMTERSGSIGLAAGTHALTIRFAQGTGGYGLNVRWQGPSITKQAIPAGVLSTTATPVVAGVDPAFGPTAGGTTVTISGSDFTSDVSVTIGGAAATSVVVAGDGLSLTALTPARSMGLATVVVTNRNGLSTSLVDGFLFQGPAPVISGVSPQIGPIAGGTTVLIYGSNFAANPTVRFDGVLATNVSLNNGVISARTAAGTRGPVEVSVTNTDGTVGTRSPGFYYQGPAPTITSISPTRGPMAGGTVVTISGTNFVAGATVTFDGLAQAGVTVVDANTITLTTVAGAQGPANVVVTNTDLTRVTSSNGYIFEGPAPTVTGISPASGALAGGTLVTITGSNFVAGAEVAFDGVAATGVTVVDPGTITATTPAGSQGPADVMVTNVDLLAATLSDGYIFLGQPPVVDGVSPTTVPNNYLATPITISGSGFAAGVEVTIGGVGATVTSVTATSITVTLPPGLAPGPAAIVVTNVDLQTTTFNGFIVQGPTPILLRIDVPHGPVAGGRLMTLTGSAFRPGAIVTMGGLQATVMSLTATTITAMTPPNVEGPVAVIVTNDDLLSSQPLTYTYYTKVNDHTVGNGCGTGGGFAVFLLLTFLTLTRGGGRRR